MDGWDQGAPSGSVAVLPGPPSVSDRMPGPTGPTGKPAPCSRGLLKMSGWAGQASSLSPTAHFSPNRQA